MILYLIKSSLCLFILFAFYKLFLENEKMHQFKRWYLLLSLGLSFCIPFIPISSIITLVAQPVDYQAVEWIANPGLISASDFRENTQMGWKDLIIPVYFMVAVLFLIRFMYNLVKIVFKIYHNEVQSFYRYTLVLLTDVTVPFTFLKYIFVNKREHQDGRLSPAIYRHEGIHAQQLHSVDVLLIEFLKCLFWFNPVLWFYKSSIQLNHEFIADQGVLRHHDRRHYQQLLLRGGRNSHLSLTSNLSFIHTKKRLTMITKPVSYFRASIYAMLSMTMLFCLSLLFGNHSLAQERVRSNEQIDKNTFYKHALFATKHDNGGYQLRSFRTLSINEKA